MGNDPARKAAPAMAFKEAVMDKLNDVATRLPPPAKQQLKSLEQKTGQPQSVLLLGVFIAVSLVVLLVCPEDFLFDLVGAVYPTYATLRMLARGETKEDAAMWSTYWCLFAAVRFISGILDFILSWLPFVSYLKLALLVFLYSPFTRGSEKVLKMFLEPKVLPLLKPAAK